MYDMYRSYGMYSMYDMNCMYRMTDHTIDICTDRKACTLRTVCAACVYVRGSAYVCTTKYTKYN